MPTLIKRSDPAVTSGWELPMPERPSASPPTIPDDLGELPDSELMQTFHELTQWANFLETRLTEQELEEDQAETDLNLAESMFLIKAVEGDKQGIQFARLLRDADPDIQELRRTLMLARASRKRLAAHQRAVERSASFLSRELTRRTSLAPYERRGGTGG